MRQSGKNLAQLKNDLTQVGRNLAQLKNDLTQVGRNQAQLFVDVNVLYGTLQLPERRFFFQRKVTA